MVKDRHILTMADQYEVVRSIEHLSGAILNE